MGKKQKMVKRREILEEAVREKIVFCTHHRYTLDQEDIAKHRCYMGNHGNNYCQYVRVFDK